MAATAKFTVRHIEATGTSRNTENFNCDPAKINVNISSDTAVALDTFARAFVNLSKDTYEDSIITQTVSLNEIIAESE